MTDVVVFDVNETLLDLQVLDEHFERVFGDAAVRDRWFGLVLRNAMTLTITGDYTDFVDVGGASLQMIADLHDVVMSEHDRTAIREAMASLPAHIDVLPALRRLQTEGVRLAALTNSPPDAAMTQLENAGLAPFFERIMSVETAGRFKPAREVYEMAAELLGISTGRMMMVAAHDWDVAGAMRAGCKGAYVLRAGSALNPLYPYPDIVEPDLLAVAEKVLAL